MTREVAGGSDALGRRRRMRMAAIGVAAVAAVAALQALATFVPRDPYLDLFFAFEAYRGETLPIAAMFVAAAIAVVAVLGCSWGAGLRTAALRLPLGSFQMPLLSVLLAAACGYWFWTMPSHTVSGDAGSVVQRVAAGDIYPSNALTSLLHIGVARTFGFSSLQAIQLVSCVSGVIAALLVLPLTLRLGVGRSMRVDLVAAIWLLTTGSFSLFFGTIEVYAPLQAAVLAYVWLALRAIRDGGAAWPAGLALGLALVLHGSAGVLLPSLLLLGWLSEGRGFRRFASAAAGFAAPVVATVAVLVIFVWQGSPPQAGPQLYGSFLGAMGHGPVVAWSRSTETLLHRYVLLDLDHTVSVLNVLMLACPGLVLCLLGRRLFRTIRHDRVAWWLMVAVAPLFLYPWLWNVSYHLRQDWDLFMVLGVPSACLAVRLLMVRRERTLLVTGAMLGLMMFVPLVVHRHAGDPSISVFENTVASAIDPASASPADVESSEYWRGRLEAGAVGRAAPHLELAGRLTASGRLVEAEVELRRARAEAPQEAYVVFRLGELIAAQGRRAEADELLWQAVRDGRYLLEPWLTLALLAAPDDPWRAIELLEAGIPRGGLDPSLPRALDVLASLYRQVGEQESAAALAARLEELKRRAEAAKGN